MSQSYSTEPKAVSLTPISAQNQFTSEMELMAGDTVSISIIYGDLAATTIQLQRRLPGQTTFQNIPKADGTFGWTASVEGSYVADERQTIRLGVPTGSYGSGGTTAAIRLGKG